jgi:ceramide glucosyltransferase
VNNLVKSFREAANDILWTVDSNVWVQSGTLARSVDALTSPTSSGKRVAVVHHVPFAYATESKLGSRVEEAFLNTNHAKMYVAINTVAIESCVMGKSNMYRRSDVDRINGSLKPIESNDPNATSEGQCGLAAFGNFLAEDNAIASAMWHELGVRHDLSCDVARNVVGNMSMLDYIQRRARWIRVRKHMVLAATLLEPFTESAVLCMIASISLHYLIGFPIFVFVFLHTAFWLAVDLDVYSSIAGYPLPASIRWEFLAGWCVRELTALPIFLYALFGDTVSWRGREYKVLRNGKVSQSETGGGGWQDWWNWSRTRKDYEPVRTTDDV